MLKKNLAVKAVLALLVVLTGVVIAPAPAMAVAMETNDGVYTSASPSGLDCTGYTGVTVCFQSNGDKWWVYDASADGASAAVYWENFDAEGDLYRKGYCFHSGGAGSGWYTCTKNYKEGSALSIRAAIYDRSAGQLKSWSSSPIWSNA